MEWLWRRLHPLLHPSPLIEAPPQIRAPPPQRLLSNSDLWESFSRFDKDKSGTIDRSELKDAMRFFGFHVDDKEINRMFNELDKNNSNTIDFEEFVHVSTLQIGERSSSNIIFNRLRKSNDRIIKHEDLKKVAEQHNIQLSNEDISDMIKCASKKDIGGVDEDDFYELLREIKFI
ncbi:hypothetical protein GOP47_0021439 [Adiantum capillus-veneris]|uniref:EF-hand domain-containing protein n=1 Tax=Adiantum capillus-veneris TaxID=13818 RepID=A0A9D4U8D0_ADICA|nr:hypothetical protein GOP47_0021439 [Adiantum capillus-veneris]